MDAIRDADVFLGLSAPRVLTKEMVSLMGARPIIFALANPTPEILPEDVKEVRPDAIIATGRSDYPNQVNNVLCFPFIFRGALDVGATEERVLLVIEDVSQVRALESQLLRAEKLATIERHVDLMASAYDDRRALASNLKKYVTAYAKGLRGSAAFRERVLHADDADTMVELARAFFAGEREAA